MPKALSRVPNVGFEPNTWLAGRDALFLPKLSGGGAKTTQRSNDRPHVSNEQPYLGSGYRSS
jgi:hypothetical protein